MIRVLIADDHPVARTALRELLNGAEGISAVAEAADGREAVQLARRFQPDVVLMDVSMPNLSGLEATRLLAGEEAAVRVLMFSAECRPDLVREAREAGAAGFLAKGCRGTEILRAIRSVRAGRSAWPSWASPRTGARRDD